MIIRDSILRFAACGLVITAAGCGGSNGSAVPQTPPARQGSAPETSSRASLEARIESSIDKSIHGQQRQLIKEAMLGLPKDVQSHISAKFRFVRIQPTKTGLTAMGNKAGLDKVATLLMPITPGSNQYIAPGGQRFSAPAFDVPRRTTRRHTASVMVQENPGSGEYRRIITPDASVVTDPAGFNRADTTLGLTCQASSAFAPGDGAYTYFESRSDYDPSQVTTGWNVEAGLQYQAGTQTFAPYFRLTGDPEGHNGGFVFFQDATATSSRDAGRVSWSCFNDPNAVRHLGMTYSIDVASDGFNPENSFYLNTYDANDATNFLSIQYILPPQYYPWQGYDKPCSGCVMIRVTSISQPPPGNMFLDGSIFGPVSWTNSTVTTANSDQTIPWPTLSLCNNYPGWTNDNFNECYSGPPSGAQNNNITVNYTDTSNETVTISNN